MHFFINKAMGIGNSGVEHAQFYRGKMFDLLGLPYKYVFTELIKELPEAEKNWKIRPEQVINMWEFFTLESNYLYQGAQADSIRKDQIIIDDTNTHRIVETRTSNGLLIREHLEKSPSPKKPDLLLVSRYKVEIFNEKTGQRKVMFNEINHPRRGKLLENIHLFDFEGKHQFFRNEVLLQRFFYEILERKFDEKNIFYLDRGEIPEVALYNHPFLKAPLVEIIHADHLANREVPADPLWNNYYEYLFNHTEAVAKIVSSTQLQTEDLWLDFPDQKEKFVTIPVGGIRDQKAEPAEANKKKPRKFVSASRLASEKHLDLVIRAIAELHQTYPEISLDIYGQGGEKPKLDELIKELKAESYIELKGHSNHLEEIYRLYDVFISASYSEGFGLTYIEALDAGLPIVTFKARFGAMELVQDGVNGFLKDFSRINKNYSLNQLIEGIKQVLEADFSQLRENTRSSVAQYQDSKIAQKWKELIDAL